MARNSWCSNLDWKSFQTTSTNHKLSNLALGHLHKRFGGGVDLSARIVAAHLQPLWGKSFVVENRTGGASNIAADAESGRYGVDFAAAHAETIRGQIVDDRAIR
jgi:hypothetical protein